MIGVRRLAYASVLATLISFPIMAVLFGGGSLFAEFFRDSPGLAAFSIIPAFVFSMFGPLLLPWSSVASLVFISIGTTLLGRKPIMSKAPWALVGGAIGLLVASVMRWEFGPAASLEAGSWLTISAMVTGGLSLLVARSITLE